MFKPITVFRCVCDKCAWEWTTKTEDLPKVCSRCKSLKWNDKEEVPKGSTYSVTIKRVKNIELQEIPVAQINNNDFDTDFDFGS